MNRRNPHQHTLEFYWPTLCQFVPTWREKKKKKKTVTHPRVPPAPPSFWKMNAPLDFLFAIFGWLQVAQNFDRERTWTDLRNVDSDHKSSFVCLLQTIYNVFKYIQHFWTLLYKYLVMPWSPRILLSSAGFTIPNFSHAYKWVKFRIQRNPLFFTKFLFLHTLNRGKFSKRQRIHLYAWVKFRRQCLVFLEGTTKSPS